MSASSPMRHAQLSGDHLYLLSNSSHSHTLHGATGIDGGANEEERRAGNAGRSSIEGCSFKKFATTRVKNCLRTVQLLLRSPALSARLHALRVCWIRTVEEHGPQVPRGRQRQVRSVTCFMTTRLHHASRTSLGS